MTDRLEELPGALVLFVTGFLGHFLCLPFALFGAWRARLVALWVPIAFTVALAAAQALQPFGSGLLILAAAMVALAYVFSRLDWRPREQTA